MRIFNVQNVHNIEEICLHRTLLGAKKCKEEKNKIEFDKRFIIIEEEADEKLFEVIDE